MGAAKNGTLRIGMWKEGRQAEADPYERMLVYNMI